MADNHDSLMREVQEELDREKYQQIWDKYANYIVGAAIAVVFAVGGYKYWEHASRTAVETAGASYESAIDLLAKKTPTADDTTTATEALEALAKDSPGGYKSLSTLQLAGRNAKAGDSAAALKAYDTLANDTQRDTILREFAALQAATLRVGDADWTEIENRLTPLVAEKGAFRHSALQLLGVAAFKVGKIDKARGAFEQLMADPKIPTTIRDRATLYMAQIVAKDIALESANTDTSKDSKNAKTGETQTETPATTATPEEAPGRYVQ